MINIRPASDTDRAAILAIILPVFRAGETYTMDREITEVAAIDYWFEPGKETFVAEADGVILGTYYLRPNQSDGGSHVCNCGYITSLAAAGTGVAGRMCEHSLETARLRGFRAMQFNFVVSTNDRAIRLWQRYGFDIVGRLPGAFCHPQAGEVDALVLYRKL